MGSRFEVGEDERDGRGAASYGLVTELVDRGEPARGREGIVHIGGLATVCLVEQIPTVGDLIRGQAPGIVERVKITRRGRVLIYARPLPAFVP